MEPRLSKKLRLSSVIMAMSASGLVAWYWRTSASSDRSSQEPKARQSLAVRVQPDKADPSGDLGEFTSHQEPAFQRPSVASGEADDSEPPAFPPPPKSRYKARPEGEWQGMLVDLASQPPCLDGAYCGLGRACVDEVCTACESDSDCGNGEACVLDHCLIEDRVKCRSTRECPTDSMCILSGYTPDPRGNGGMDATCVSLTGGSGSSDDLGLTAEQAAAAAAQPQREAAFDSELDRARSQHRLANPSP